MGWKYVVVREDKPAVAIHDLLYEKLLNVKKIQKRLWDCCICIAGFERAGKSTMGLTIGYILSDGTLTVNNIAANTTEAIEKLENLPDKSVLVIDEAALMLSSKDVMKKEQRQIIKILNIIGMKRMILIVIIPNFFDLNRYIAVDRSRFLIKVYSDKNGKRGRFAYWGEKRKSILYKYGKKHYDSYDHPKANFRGTFKNFSPLGQEYLDLKEKSLWSALKGKEKITIDDKRYMQGDYFLYKILKKRWMTQKELEKELITIGYPTSQQNLSLRYRKIQEIMGKLQLQDHNI